MEFQAERLDFARKRRQMTIVELARRSKLTARSIQRYESGEEPPSEDAISRMAQALSFPPGFFVSKTKMPDVAEGALSFRAYSKLKVRMRTNAVAVARLAVEIANHIGQLYDFPDVNVPDLSEETSDPIDAARLVRAAWGLGNGPIRNVVHELERHGVRVFSLADDIEDVDAFCFWRKTTPFVVLNRTKSGERGRWDGAHELGHLVLHRQIDFRGKDVEREANLFAGEFLVPKQTLLSQLPPVITIDTVMKLKRYWKISAMAMVKRLHDVGRLSPWVYRSMCIELGSRGYRTAEKDGIEVETSSLLAGIFDSATEGGISIAELARALNLTVADVAPLLFIRRLRLVR